MHCNQRSIVLPYSPYRCCSVLLYRWVFSSQGIFRWYLLPVITFLVIMDRRIRLCKTSSGSVGQYLIAHYTQTFHSLYLPQTFPGVFEFHSCSPGYHPICYDWSHYDGIDFFLDSWVSSPSFSYKPPAVVALFVTSSIRLFRVHSLSTVCVFLNTLPLFPLNDPPHLIYCLCARVSTS